MYIDRQVYQKIEKQKDNGKVTILIGARQVGKTTLLRKLFQSLSDTNQCLFLDLDVFSDYEQVSTYEDLIHTLKLKGYREKQQETFFLFLDEFQRGADISRVLKTVVDHHQNIKIYASGSSSLAISEKIQESLAGRKRIIRVYPLNFIEYLHFRHRQDLVAELVNLVNVQADNLPKLMPEVYRELQLFMVFGGYPEVALVDDEEKKDVLRSIFDLYVKKDLVDFLKIERIKNAKTLIQRLAVNHGQETRYNRLAQVVGIDEKTVKNYLEILKETFIITVHSPWFTNPLKELVKMPKVYFFDAGVRNYFINNFNELDVRDDASFLFEGYVISELIKAGVETERIKFWRTKNRREVDVILDVDGRVRPVEIKYKNVIGRSDTLGLRRFVDMYPDAEKPVLVTWGSNLSNDEVIVSPPFNLGTLGTKKGTDLFS